MTLLALHQMLDVTIPYQDASALRFFRLDLIRELKRLNAHLVAGAVRPILERSGGLPAGRIALWALQVVAR